MAVLIRMHGVDALPFDRTIYVPQNKNQLEKKETHVEINIVRSD